MDMMELVGVSFLFLLAAAFWVFKPIRLVAGFMFATDEEINKYNKDRICRCMAIYLAILSLVILCVSYFEVNSGIEILITIIMTVILLIVLNSKKMKNNKGVV